MITVREAWFAFSGLCRASRVRDSDDAIEKARHQYPELGAENDQDLFTQFATKIDGLTKQQAEAMYWKDWFWTVRQAHVTYDDDPQKSAHGPSLRQGGSYA